MAKNLSGKAKKTPPTQVSADRYNFIGLSETEPDLGTPSTANQVLTSSVQPDAQAQHIARAEFDASLGARRAGQRVQRHAEEQGVEHLRPALQGRHQGGDPAQRRSGHQARRQRQDP